MARQEDFPCTEERQLAATAVQCRRGGHSEKRQPSLLPTYSTRRHWSKYPPPPRTCVISTPGHPRTPVEEPIPFPTPAPFVDPHIPFLKPLTLFNPCTLFLNAVPLLNHIYPQSPAPCGILFSPGERHPQHRGAEGRPPSGHGDVGGHRGRLCVRPRPGEVHPQELRRLLRHQRGGVPRGTPEQHQGGEAALVTAGQMLLCALGWHCC